MERIIGRQKRHKIKAVTKTDIGVTNLKMTEVDELDGCAQEWGQGRGLWGGPATEIPRSYE